MSKAFKPINEVKDAKAARKRRKAFYTPLDLVSKLVEWSDVWPSARVLEPSAGDGRIVHALFEAGVKAVNACELDAAMNARCADMGATMIGTDFLKCNPDKKYDRVIMNPPFERSSADKHIEHAFKFLVPGGELYSIAPKTTGESLADMKLDLFECSYATFETLGSDLFREFGTNIEVLIVEIHKERPGDEIETLGFCNGVTANFALAIESDQKRWKRWCEDPQNVGRKFSRELALEGNSIYGVDWHEVEKHLRLKAAEERGPVLFALACTHCDAGMGIESEAEAKSLGWTQIEYDDGPAWNFLGMCPDCPREFAEERARLEAERAANPEPVISAPIPF